MDTAAGDKVSVVGPVRLRQVDLAERAGGPASARRRRGWLRVQSGPRPRHGVSAAACCWKWRPTVDNALLPADIVGLPREAAVQRAAAMLDMVGLTGFADKLPCERSGGMQRRLAIARPPIRDPKLVPDGRAVRRAGCGSRSARSSARMCGPSATCSASNRYGVVPGFGGCPGSVLRDDQAHWMSDWRQQIDRIERGGWIRGASGTHGALQRVLSVPRSRPTCL